MQAQIAAGRELTYDDFSVLKNSLLNSPQMKELLDHFAVEDSFEPGDAPIFDKYVLHRSVQLGEGPVPSRLAYALRFSSVGARYDKKRVEALAFPRVTFNYDVGSDFNEKVASEDGEQVYAGSYSRGQPRSPDAALRPRVAGRLTRRPDGSLGNRSERDTHGE